MLYLNGIIIEINKPPNDGMNIIKQLKEYFKDETQIENDTLFPLANGIKSKIPLKQQKIILF